MGFNLVIDGNEDEANKLSTGFGMEQLINFFEGLPGYSTRFPVFTKFIEDGHSEDLDTIRRELHFIISLAELKDTDSASILKQILTGTQSAKESITIC